jgi:hypothetical protein
MIGKNKGTVFGQAGYKRAQTDTIRTNGLKIGDQTKAQRHKIWAQKVTITKGHRRTQFAQTGTKLVISQRHEILGTEEGTNLSKYVLSSNS